MDHFGRGHLGGDAAVLPYDNTETDAVAGGCSSTAGHPDVPQLRLFIRFSAHRLLGHDAGGTYSGCRLRGAIPNGLDEAVAPRAVYCTLCLRARGGLVGGSAYVSTAYGAWARRLVYSSCLHSPA